jgi:hypothetical protein
MSVPKILVTAKDDTLLLRTLRRYGFSTKTGDTGYDYIRASYCDEPTIMNQHFLVLLEPEGTSQSMKRVSEYVRHRGYLHIWTTREMLYEFLDTAIRGSLPARIVPTDELYYPDGYQVPEIPKDDFYVALLGAIPGEYIELPGGSSFKYAAVYHKVSEL